MCGIYFSSSTKRHTRPRCLEHLIPHREENFCLLELSENEISPILSEFISSQTTLTEGDQRKLDNLQEIQNLQLKLNKYKNARNDDMVTLVEQQMATLAVDNVPPPRDDLDVIHKIIPEILARGPDYAQYREVAHGKFGFQLFSSVLSLRQPFTTQPVNGHDFILQFNGELYNDECLGTNDTYFITEKLNNELQMNKLREEAIMSVICLLDGEFAYVMTDLLESRIYFGKDYVGKRSLLYSVQEDGITISSVFLDRRQTVKECMSDRIHTYDLREKTISTRLYSELWTLHNQQKMIFRPIDLDFSPSAEHMEIRIQSLTEVLLRATLLRQQTIHPLHPSREHLELGVLFSGGLDCTVVAGLIAQNYDLKGEKAVIDLLTVGFENPRTSLGARDSPDRKLSERSWFELSKAFEATTVKFRLVQVDVLYSEWLSHKNHVLDLIYPRSTEMDLSIAIAFYFACRARLCEALEIASDISSVDWSTFSSNLLAYVSKLDNYTSETKVLFSGLGADELFGGYSRHENIFNDLDQGADPLLVRKKYQELSASLIGDIEIIYDRNLGRDDRAMACWGKELRYPFLDHSVIGFVVNEIEPQYKINYEWATLKTKKGEKIVKRFVRKYILRCLARKLNLNMAAEEIKRAIQFGAKSAKLEVGQSKTRGTDVLSI